MYRRRRRRGGKKYSSSIMHLPSSVNQSLTTNAGLVFFASTSANYATTGTPLTSDSFEQADRSQQVPIGSDINSIVYNISFRDGSAQAVMELAFFKIERAHVTPSLDNVLLPTEGTIGSQGLQAAFRQYQPGRLLKYLKVAIAPEQPRTLSVRVPYKKFKMAKVRTGDFYGVVIYNRSSATTGVDVEARYNAKV